MSFVSPKTCLTFFQSRQEAISQRMDFSQVGVSRKKAPGCARETKRSIFFFEVAAKHGFFGPIERLFVSTGRWTADGQRSEVAILQTVNACQVLLHKLDSSQELTLMGGRFRFFFFVFWFRVLRRGDDFLFILPHVGASSRDQRDRGRLRSWGGTAAKT